MLDKVIEVVETYEWIQGKRFKYDGDKIVGCCLSGAIDIVFPDDIPSDAYLDTVSKIMTRIRQLDPPIYDMPFYNDHVVTSKEEVLELLRSIEQ